MSLKYEPAGCWLLARRLFRGAVAVLDYCSYLTQSVFKFVLQKSIPTQIRQLILYIRNSEEYVDDLVGELTF